MSTFLNILQMVFLCHFFVEVLILFFRLTPRISPRWNGGTTQKLVCVYGTLNVFYVFRVVGYSQLFVLKTSLRYESCFLGAFSETVSTGCKVLSNELETLQYQLGLYLTSSGKRTLLQPILVFRT